MTRNSPRPAGESMARTYAVETFGCQMNVHDGERLGGLLQQAGYARSAAAEDADLIVVNTCSVREKAAEKLFARLDRFRNRPREERPLVAVTGCVAQQEGPRIVDRAPVVDVVIGTQALAMLPRAVDEAERTGRPQVDTSEYGSVSFPLGVAVRDDPVKAWVTVIEGCNDFCSFCVVPYTRGRERMRPAAEIVAEVSAAAAAGHREVHLLGQIVNHYRAPDAADCDFAGLLERVHDVDGIERIRFTSPHPSDMDDGVIDALADCDKVAPYVHLPLQAASNRVLERMARGYTVEAYAALVARLRNAVPGLALSTDVIVGFPGEDEADFRATRDFMAETRYDFAYMFKYSAREGTKAYQWDETVSEAEKGRRLQEIIRLQEAIGAQCNRALVGERVDVLVEGPAKKPDGWLAGKDPRFKTVVFPDNGAQPGDLVPVHVTSATAHTLRGTART